MAVTLVQAVSTTSLSNIGSISATLTSVNVGDLIVVVFDYTSSAPTWSFNASDTSLNSYTSVIAQIGGSGASDIYAFSSVAAAAGSSVIVSVKAVGHNISGLLTVYQFRGASTSTPLAVGTSYTSLQSAGTVATTTGQLAVMGSYVVTAGNVYITAQNPTYSPITSHLGTYTADDSLSVGNSLALYTGHVAISSSGTVTVTYTPNPNTQQWRGTIIQIVVWPPTGGAITGSGGVGFSASGTLTGKGALSGTASLAFGASMVPDTGGIDGSSVIKFGGTGTLTGVGALSGNATLTFGASANTVTIGALSGTATLTFGASGTVHPLSNRLQPLIAAVDAATLALVRAIRAAGGPL